MNENAGLLSSLPADQASYTLHESEAKIPELKTEIADTANRISILTGTVPGALNDKLLTPSPLPDIDSAMYNAIPAEVLRQRPDVRAAEMAWAAQIAKTKEAKAEMKPKFSILGVLGLAALSGGLFSAGSHAFGIMPQVSYPLFNGGALKRNVRVQSEKEKEMQSAYENTVLKAAGEVRSAMTAISRIRSGRTLWKREEIRPKKHWIWHRTSSPTAFPTTWEFWTQSAITCPWTRTIPCPKERNSPTWYLSSKHWAAAGNRWMRGWKKGENREQAYRLPAVRFSRDGMGASLGNELCEAVRIVLYTHRPQGEASKPSTQPAAPAL